MVSKSARTRPYMQNSHPKCNFRNMVRSYTPSRGKCARYGSLTPSEKCANAQSRRHYNDRVCGRIRSFFATRPHLGSLKNPRNGNNRKRFGRFRWYSGGTSRFKSGSHLNGNRKFRPLWNYRDFFSRMNLRARSLKNDSRRQVVRKYNGRNSMNAGTSSFGTQ